MVKLRRNHEPVGGRGSGAGYIVRLLVALALIIGMILGLIYTIK